MLLGESQIPGPLTPSYTNLLYRFQCINRLDPVFRLRGLKVDDDEGSPNLNSMVCSVRISAPH